MQLFFAVGVERCTYRGMCVCAVCVRVCGACNHPQLYAVRYSVLAWPGLAWGRRHGGRDRRLSIDLLVVCFSAAAAAATASAVHMAYD